MSARLTASRTRGRPPIISPSPGGCIEPPGSPSFSRRQLGLSFDRRLAPAEQPVLQPVEIDVDHRCRVQREQLRYGETANDGVAQRLADLGAGTGAEHHRNAAE